jgi:hypothetical protein
MVSRHRSAKVRLDRDRSPRHSARSRNRLISEKPEGDYGVPVPEALSEALEQERDNLAKAQSVLACMAVSLLHDTDPLSGPNYSDVAQVARELVARSIDGLDPFVLKQRLRDKVEEYEFLLPFIAGAYALPPRAKLEPTVPLAAA